MDNRIYERTETEVTWDVVKCREDLVKFVAFGFLGDFSTLTIE